MLAVLETTKGVHTVNLEKILFFYPIKSGACARLEMEDGTLIDIPVPYDEVNKRLAAAGVTLPL
jgi:hypothetical protein